MARGVELSAQRESGASVLGVSQDQGGICVERGSCMREVSCNEYKRREGLNREEGGMGEEVEREEVVENATKNKLRGIIKVGGALAQHIVKR